MDRRSLIKKAGIAGVLAAGIGIVWLGLAATKPVLERVALTAE